MQSHHATLIGACLSLALILSVVPAHAQASAASAVPWRLTVHAEVQADLMALARAPIVIVDASFEDGLGRLGINVSRDLSQTGDYEIELRETLKHREWRFGTELTWHHGSMPSAGITVGWRPSWGQVELNISAPPSPLNWELSGRFRSDQLQLNLHKLTGTLAEATVDHATMQWSPEFAPSTLGVRFNRAQSPPLTLELDVPLPDDVNLRTTHLFVPNNDGWRWQTTTLTALRTPVEASVDLSPHGWQALTAALRHDLTDALEGATVVVIAPTGWQESEVGLTWKPDLMNRLSGTITLRPDGWSFRPSGNWQTTHPAASVNGSLSLGPRGIGSGRVIADATLNALSLDGVLNATGSTWLLDLSANLDQEPWQLNVESSWLARLGWDQGKLRFGRDWSWLLARPDEAPRPSSHRPDS